MSEIITFGEAMVRLTPPQFQRLEQARSFDVEIGGAELNTAAGLVRLGRTAAWVSRLPNNPLGRMVASRVREAGVCDRQVQFVEDGRCGVYFLENGASPRPSSIVYDRENTSISRIEPGKTDWRSIFAEAKWFHVTGITAALSNSTALVVAEALAAAKAVGLRTSIDLNYRAKLWTPSQAGRVMAELIPGCDLLFASIGDAEQLFGVSGANFAEVAAALTDRFRLGAVVGTKRETPRVWQNRFGTVGYTGGHFFETPWYDVEIVDRLGAGDTMASGVIHGLLDDDFEKGLAYGAAMGAIKHTIPGDFPWIERAEVEAVLSGQGLKIQR